MIDAPKPNGAAGGSNPIRLVGSIPTGAATSHTVALIRMGEDGKITYGGDKTWVHELVSRLVANHDA